MIGKLLFLMIEGKSAVVSLKFNFAFTEKILAGHTKSEKDTFVVKPGMRVLPRPIQTDRVDLYSCST